MQMQMARQPSKDGNLPSFREPGVKVVSFIRGKSTLHPSQCSAVGHARQFTLGAIGVMRIMSSATSNAIALLLDRQNAFSSSNGG